MQRVEKSIRVKAPVEQVYRYWRSFENFPSFMEHVEEVRTLDSTGRRSHWKLKGPLGKTVEYDAELTKDEPNKLIGWNSTGGDMQTTGEVTFTPLDENTEVHVIMQWYDPPALIRSGFDLDAFAENTLKFIYTEPTSTLPIKKFWLWLAVPIAALDMTIHAVANVIEGAPEDPQVVPLPEI